MSRMDLLDEVSLVGMEVKPDPVKGTGRECYAFSDIEDEVLKLLEIRALQLMRKYDCDDFEISRDAAGNLFVTIFGQDRTKFVMSGSHVDSVKNGGKYDGMAGVNGAFNFLERVLASGATPEKSIRIVAFRAEESSPRTGIACLGSRIACGTINRQTLERLEYRMDEGSVRFKDYIISKYGAQKWQDILAETSDPPIKSEEVVGYEELHIEQSRVCEIESKDIGLVCDGIGGSVREVLLCFDSDYANEYVVLQDKPLIKVQVKFKGEESHTGGTPPNPVLKKKFSKGKSWYRSDALIASCEFTRLVSRVLKLRGIPLLITGMTMGKETGFTTIPGYEMVEMHVHEQDLENFRETCDMCMNRVGENTNVSSKRFELEKVEQGKVKYFDERVLKFLELPIATERIAREEVNQQKGEGASVGRVRATVTDFYLNENVGLECKLDFRDVDTKGINDVIEAVHKKFQNLVLSAGGNIVNGIRRISAKCFAPVDNNAAEVKENIAKSANLTVIRMPSLPGHDAGVVADAGIPVSMTYVRHNGLSHSPYETVDDEYYEKAEVISHAYLAHLAGLNLPASTTAAAETSTRKSASKTATATPRTPTSAG